MENSETSICSRRVFLILAALFVLALVPRLYGAHTVGWNWDHPGSFTLINFDEAGSCRAALGGFDYSTFVGRQTIAIATLVGRPPPEGTANNGAAAKAYCHNASHINIARAYSAVAGALTVVLIGLLSLMLVPKLPAVAWTASSLLALSGFHMSESQTGTVDAPSTFFIYLLLTCLVFALRRQSTVGIAISPLFLLPAIWTKYWVFAVFAYLVAVPDRLWVYLLQGLSARRIVMLGIGAAFIMGLSTNAAFPINDWFPALGLFYLLVPWRRVAIPVIPLFLLVPVLAYYLPQIGVIASFTTSGLESNFGTGYAAIGWNKWLRNMVNVPAVIIVGLGLPACWFIPAGVRALMNKNTESRLWLVLAPIAIFALYLLFLSPVTYYRHYLPLIPAAALIAAYGLWTSSVVGKRWFYPLFLPLFFAWPALLALDIEQDYQQDPRIELRQWYAENPDAKVWLSYYVSPPPSAMRQSNFFAPEYAFGDANNLRQGSHLILSENWYDTAFASELNGPITHYPERLIKTKPAYVDFYTAALDNRHPHLELERAIDVQNFMPELLLHKKFYGTFQMFVGDIKIFRVVK
jgi:hypothetical protein